MFKGEQNDFVYHDAHDLFRITITLMMMIIILIMIVTDYNNNYYLKHLYSSYHYVSKRFTL